MTKYDAILIPGGGLREKGDLPLYVKKRLDRAIEIHKDEIIITLSAGTTHKPPFLDKGGFPLFESVAAAKYLMRKNINPDKILTETCSYDTIGNAYFSRMIHTESRNLRTLLIITSAFHLPRTEIIFKWIYNLDPLQKKYTLYFEPVPDIGIDKDALLLRKEKEKKRITQLMKLKGKIDTLYQLHKWLFTEHDAYSVSGTGKKKESGKILSTY